MRKTPMKALVTLCVLSLGLNTSGAKQKVQKALEEDARDLYSQSAEIRAGAATRLTDAGPAAIAWLLPVVCDSSKPNFRLAWPLAAKVLGKLKADAATGCLVEVVASADLTMNVFRPEKTIYKEDPAFAALVQIGEPTIPVIARYLPSLDPNRAYLALRVLRIINTPGARATVEAYISILRKQTQLANDVLDDFKYGPGMVK